jgi:hypothetical protein
MDDTGGAADGTDDDIRGEEGHDDIEEDGVGLGRIPEPGDGEEGEVLR